MKRFTISLEDEYMKIIEESMKKRQINTKVKVIREALEEYAKNHADKIDITISINSKGKVVSIDEKK